MSVGSNIEWTDATWNPTTGCRKVSPGCDHCYAATLAKRLKAMGNPRYQTDGKDGEGFGLALHWDKIEEPLTWRKPRRVFVNSMSDLFHPQVPEDFLTRVFTVMAEASQHQFQVLTKRPTLMARVVPRLVDSMGEVPPNIWLGTSIESEDYLSRADWLRKTPAAIRFLSLEPLLGPLGNLELHDIHWVIVGGESGPRHRPINAEWVTEIQDKCRRAGVPFFFKQWGGRTPKANGRELAGQTWDEMPAPPQSNSGGERTMPDETIWEADPHTLAKHEILRRYLEAWYPILGSWQGRVHYLDAFAGPGIYTGGQPGSPIVALQTLLDHPSLAKHDACEFVFTFLEAREDRFDSLKEQVAALEQRRGGFPKNVRVHSKHTKFDQGAEGMLAGLVGKARLAPTLAFIDPFGFSDIDINLVSRLLGFDQCEVLFTFMHDHINRFLEEGKVASHLKALFGTNGFQQAASKSGNDRKVFLHDLFKKQLMSVCDFKYVQSFEMVDQRNHTVYFLFYGTRDLKGLEVMKKAMWKADPGSGSRFLDRFAGQEVLLAGENVDVEPLRKALLARFSGQEVGVSDVGTYVLTDTPYASNHWNQKVLKPLEKEEIIQVVSSPRKKRYSFPPGTVVRFP